jgi:hypothetical protein
MPALEKHANFVHPVIPKSHFKKFTLSIKTWRIAIKRKGNFRQKVLGDTGTCQSTLSMDPECSSSAWPSARGILLDNNITAMAWPLARLVDNRANGSYEVVGSDDTSSECCYVKDELS